MDRQEVLRSLLEYPNINKYMRHIITERLQKPNWDSSPVLRIFLDPDNSPDALEELLFRTRGVANFALIFEPSLGADPHPDEKIYDVLAEVRALSHLLYQRRFQDVTIVPRSQTKTVDITANYASLNFAIEVKHLHGPEFKHHKQIGKAFLVDQQQNIKNVVSRQVQKALKQLNAFRNNDPVKDYQGIVLVVNTRDDVDMFYQQTVEQTIEDAQKNPSRNLYMAMVASIDFIESKGHLHYFRNPHWVNCRKVDIWPSV